MTPPLRLNGSRTAAFWLGVICLCIVQWYLTGHGAPP